MFILTSITTISATEDNSTDNSISEDQNIQITDVKKDVKHDQINDNTNQESHKNIQKINKQVKTNDNTTTTNNNDTRIKPNIRVNNNPITPGKNTTFTAIIDSDATGLGVFKINQKTIAKNIPIIKGVSIIRYNYTIPSSFQSPTYKLEFVYSGDENYQPGRVNTTLQLNVPQHNIDPKLVLKNINIKYQQNGTILLSMAKDATGNVVFKLNKSTITPKLKVTNGKASYTLNASYTPGKYRLEAFYSGNYKYKNSSIKANLYVQKLSATITQVNITSKAGSKINFNAHIVDERGNPVVSALVVYKINNKCIGNTTTNGRGYASYRYIIPSTFDYNNYTVTILSAGNKKVSPANTTSHINLTQLKTHVEISKITAKINETLTITASAVDENKNNAHKGKILFKINGVSQKLVNITNDIAIFRYKPTTNVARNYTIEAVYQGTWKYANSRAKSTIEIIKIGTITTTRYTDAKVGTSTTVSARVEDKNQVLVNGGIVVFTLNGTYLGNSTVKNGAANYTFVMPRYPKGVYRLNATYMGSNSYLKSDNLNYVNVTLLDTRLVTQPVTVEVGKTANLSVFVMDETDHFAENGKVEFRINGTLIGTAIVHNGSASIKYKPSYSYSGVTLRYIATLKANQYYASAYSINNLTVSALKDVYVSNKGNNKNLGDKNHPFKSIYYAVGHVSTLGTVHVAEGTYNENSILINESISIIGCGDKTVINGIATGKTIITVTSSNATVTIKSVLFKNGLGRGNHTAGAIKSYGKLRISSSKFIDNRAEGTFSAGAIYTLGELNLTHVDMIRNKLTTPNAEGGAIRAINTTVNIIGVNFINNTVSGSNSTGGGAIFTQNSSMLINQSKFIKNRATGKNTQGGAIKAIYGNTVVDFSTFKDNIVNGTEYGVGGAINGLGSGLIMNRSYFEANHAYSKLIASAGAIYTQYAVADVYSTKFKSNTAVSNSVMGGVVEGYYAYSNYVNCTFDSNYAKASKISSFGGVVYYELGNLTMSSCIFNNNLATSKNVSIGGVMYVHANTTVYHCDFRSNKVNGTNIGGGAIGNLGNLTVSKSNFKLNNASKIGDAITAVSGSKNLIEDNYWYAQKPIWKELLRGVNKPGNYSKTLIKH